ncbi:hypothetical protein K438DRAFT_1989463 [Mycena galopus ATCC 62051]|nr:hypothetical protein K438DRAFT_1989463 [Mycena galopus ATCC 62051]
MSIPQAHSQDAIRLSTMQLSGMEMGMFSPPLAGRDTASGSLGENADLLSSYRSGSITPKNRTPVEPLQPAFQPSVTYTFGGSQFQGANGSMMIEVVPFFHILASSIAREIGPEYPQEIICTTLVAYALSSVLTGVYPSSSWIPQARTAHWIFPAPHLVGCIGGVGAFLIQTGLTVSLRISDDDFTATWATSSLSFSTHTTLHFGLYPWRSQFFSALSRKVCGGDINLYFILIPLVFYIIVAAAQLNLAISGIVAGCSRWSPEERRSTGTSSTHITQSAFWPLWSTLPTQFALLFFNILHPPLNVPALSVSLNEDIDTNKELVGHGYSNLLAGVLGTVPNYLVYVNTLLRRDSDSGLFVGCSDDHITLMGTGPIAFIPVMEALWDTRHRVSRTEYITIASIMICMTAWDFVAGVLFGIVVSCFFFVVQNSQRTSIRALHTGETAISTVRRPSSQRAYIQEVSKQTTILRLQGFLFFGTIAHVEETIRSIIDEPSGSGIPCAFWSSTFRWWEASTCPPPRRLFASTAFYLSMLPGRQDANLAFQEAGSLVGSPRRSHLRAAGHRTIANEVRPSDPGISAEPYNTLVKAFSSHADFDLDQFRPMLSYLQRTSVPEGFTLWKQNDPADGLYIIESGVLRASYKFSDHSEVIEESMVPGTLAGELSALSNLPRNASVVVERAAVLWKLSLSNLQRLEDEEPILARKFTQLVLKTAKIDNDILLSALASRQ